MAKEKEIKPLTKKIFSLDKYKAENKLNDGVKNKPLEYIELSPAFQQVTGLSVVKGTINLFRGFSNTGKSTALIETAIGAQRAGILPVILDLENSWDWDHVAKMGFEFTEVYDDVINEETGEVTKEIVDYEGFFIYINNEYLINNFGKLKDKDRDEAVIEGVAKFIDKTLDDQAQGNLDVELCFLIDSIGVLDCEQGVVSKNRSNLWSAGAYSQSFKSIVNYRIPSSRKENKKYTNTLCAVQRVWLDNMAGSGVIKHSGGEFFYFGSRLIFHFGGIQSHATKKLIAKANGKEYCYGTQTKVNVDKNHVNGISFKGEIVSTAHGFILPTDIDKYKKENKNFILSQLGESSDTPISFIEEEGNIGD